MDDVLAVTIEAFNEAAVPVNMIVTSVLSRDGANVRYQAQFRRREQSMHVSQSVNGGTNGGATLVCAFSMQTVRNWCPGKITSVQLIVDAE